MSLDARWREAGLSFVSLHRRRIIVAMAAALGGFGITAFGIAPLAPDAALLPSRTLVESLAVPDLGQQAEALLAAPLDLRRSSVTRSTDTTESLLLRLGVSDAEAASFLRADALARRVLQGRGGKLAQATTDDQGRLIRLVTRFAADRSDQRLTHFNRLTIERHDGRWTSRIELDRLTAGVRLGSGTIRNSLFGATDESGLPDAVAIQLAEIFSADIDFHRQLRKGDTFSVVYEALTADGEVVPWNEGAGRVLAAEFVNAGKTHQAVWFVDGKGRGGYFGPDGADRRRTFLASPLEFSRVTSGFAMRMHPILQTWRAHLGVDYAAPAGTPVRSVGDGVVSFAGRQNGYGNVVEVQHGNERTTLYAHLSRIDVHKGQRVSQGDGIGSVGATGWATGPHLHFEFRIKGVHQDPLILAQADERPGLEPSDKPQFLRTAQVVRTQLQAASVVGSGHRAFE